MQKTGTLSIDDSARESRLDGTLLATQGSTDQFGSATAFLESHDFTDNEEARITGTMGKIGNIDVIFMTDAAKVAAPVPAMAAAPHFEFAAQNESPLARNLFDMRDVDVTAIVPPKTTVPPKTIVPPKTTGPRKPILPPKSWVLSESGEFVEEHEAEKPATPVKARKKAARKKAAGKKAPSKSTVVSKKKAPAAKKKSTVTKKKATKKKAAGKKASGRK